MAFSLDLGGNYLLIGAVLELSEYQPAGFELTDGAARNAYDDGRHKPQR